ncbi:hypothetical protein Tsubulata_013213 [Turnera subulata]|uniref:Uncharacterized protein n=1 Tax=Turnera subulata TaxID=218843 RepID=A0A9Q0FKQ9_9ROSI|nr:hypothetical protein Tsubulata_013213 [Turnera subulata]
MADSSDSVSIDMESPSLAGKIFLVFKDYSFVQKHVPCSSTTFAYTISVLQAMRFVAQSLLGATAVSPDDLVPSVDDLADQIAEVLDYFGLGPVMCMGVTAGAYILTLFALKYRQRVLGLILISPLCNAPSWTEWLYNKVLSNLLYYYGMCGMVKELLLKRYFSKVLLRIHLLRRPDISEGLKKLRCRSLIFVGENSPFHFEALHMTSKLDRRYSALVEVQGCGSMVTEEQPHAMLIPLEYFLMGFNMYRPPKLSVSPRSPLSPICIAPELLSPESMGLKLKPIKTRMSLEV